MTQTAYTIYVPEHDALIPGETLGCKVIGTIRTPYKQMDDCPSRHNKKAQLPAPIRLRLQWWKFSLCAMVNWMCWVSIAWTERLCSISRTRVSTKAARLRAG